MQPVTLGGGRAFFVIDLASPRIDLNRAEFPTDVEKDICRTQCIESGRIMQGVNINDPCGTSHDYHREYMALQSFVNNSVPFPVLAGADSRDRLIRLCEVFGVDRKLARSIDIIENKRNKL